LDLNAMVHFAQVVKAAYAIAPENLSNSVGQTITVSLGGASTSYTVITTVYANDLATEMNPLRGTRRVSIGLILQDAAANVVIAIRGTEGILEWVQDARFLPHPCPFLAGAGHTDDGFTSMYMSFTVDAQPGSLSVAKSLATLPWRKTPVQSVTICGHSLGGALATLLALDVAANTPFTDPAAYTYASPRTGDDTFVSMYSHVVQRSCRVANRMDLVPKLPAPPLYEHVPSLFELNPVVLGLPPKVLVKPEIACEHILDSYLHLLTLKAGGDVLPLTAACVPL
jgi:lipase (class 3)